MNWNLQDILGYIGLFGSVISLVVWIAGKNPKTKRIFKYLFLGFVVLIVVVFFYGIEG